MDDVADPIILAYQLGATGSSDWPHLQSLANYLVSNGPYTPEERWEENGGYSPATMAAEIAALVCASVIATGNGDSADAATYLSKGDAFEPGLDANTYTTTGAYGNGDHYLRSTQDAAPNHRTRSGSPGGGKYDDRTSRPGYLELVRLGHRAGTVEVASTLPVVDSQLLQAPGRPDLAPASHRWVAGPRR
jgi:glucoamylase